MSLYVSCDCVKCTTTNVSAQDSHLSCFRPKHAEWKVGGAHTMVMEIGMPQHSFQCVPVNLSGFQFGPVVCGPTATGAPSFDISQLFSSNVVDLLNGRFNPAEWWTTVSGTMEMAAINAMMYPRACVDLPTGHTRGDEASVYVPQLQ